MSNNRIHPLIPNLEEAQKNPELIHSDHLAVMGQAPWKGKEPFKVITWNVYLPGYPYGFAPATAFFYTPPRAT